MFNKERDVNEMCDFLEELKENARAEGRIEGTLCVIKALLEIMPLNEALDLLNIPFEQRKMYIKKLVS